MRFAQDSWRLRSNLTLEYGVRFGNWTNNRELNSLGGYFTPDLYNPNAGSFLDPGTYQRLNGVCYVDNGCAPAGILDDRGPFALPRISAAWNIDGEGNNVVRGGYGMFYNRNMGNVEYDNTLRLPPNAYQVGNGLLGRRRLRQRRRADLRHDSGSERSPTASAASASTR